MSRLAMMCSRLVARRAEHAHRVVVRQHDVADRLVGDLADAADHVLRHHRRGLRVDHHHRVVADDDAGVRVALGRVRVGVVGQLVEADPFLSRSACDANFFSLMGIPDPARRTVTRPEMVTDHRALAEPRGFEHACRPVSLMGFDSRSGRGCCSNRPTRRSNASRRSSRRTCRDPRPAESAAAPPSRARRFLAPAVAAHPQARSVCRRRSNAPDSCEASCARASSEILVEVRHRELAQCAGTPGRGSAAARRWSWRSRPSAPAPAKQRHHVRDSRRRSQSHDA